MKIYPNADHKALHRLDSPTFKWIERKFDEWLEASNPASEYREMYFGPDAILSKKGAIRQVIEEAQSEADETFQPVDLERFDMAGIFEG